MFSENKRKIDEYSVGFSELCLSLKMPKPADGEFQFFVRTFFGKTLAVFASSNSTVESVMRHISNVTSVPVNQQLLVYSGRTLDPDRSLTDYGITKDSNVSLISRLRSTCQPRSWRILDDLILNICRLCSVTNPFSAFTLVWERNSVEYLVKKFLSTRILDAQAEKDSTYAHLQVFVMSGAGSALVRLYLSPVMELRDIADKAIRLFLAPNPDYMSASMHKQCSAIVLQFCKMLGATVGKEDELYVDCRSTLGSMLKESKGILPLVHLRSFHFLAELHLFVTDLARKLEMSLCADSILMAPVCQILLTDLSNFLVVMRWAVKECKGVDAIPEMSYDIRNAKYESGVASLHELYCVVLSKLDHTMLKVETIMIRSGEELSEDHLPVWLHFLSILTVVRKFSIVFEKGEQALHYVLFQRRRLLNVLFRVAKRNPKLCWFLKYKDVTDFEARKSLVRMMLPEGKEEDELHEMLIDRSQLLAESFEYIGQADPSSLHGGIFMEFKNEEATGPGVLREWFCLLCKSLFSQTNVLFVRSPSDHRRFFPNPASILDPLHLKYLRFTGRVIALALMHKVQVGIVFDRVFFLQLAGCSITLDDVREADPMLYRSCRQILEMDANLLDSDALGLTFTYDVEVLGSRRTIELCPGGKDINVNSKNRTDYVSLLIRNYFVTPVAQQVDQFAQGFGDILCKRKKQRFFFQSLDLEDFDRLLGGSNTVLCVKEWKAHTEYNGYKAQDKQIGWFWKILESMSDEQRHVLLFFWTSVKFLPVDGFGGLPSKLFIYKSSSSLESLPTAHTCFYRLCLPAYKTKSMMQNRLQLITQDHFSCSFGTW